MSTRETDRQLVRQRERKKERSQEAYTRMVESCVGRMRGWCFAVLCCPVCEAASSGCTCRQKERTHGCLPRVGSHAKLAHTAPTFMGMPTALLASLSSVIWFPTTSQFSKSTTHTHTRTHGSIMQVVKAALW